MTLGDIIKLLENVPDKNRIVKKGFNNPHSWRGVYEELAFEPAENVSIQSMLDCAKSALGKTFDGYKGGDFTMEEYTDVHISEKGDSYDYVWEYLFYYMTSCKFPKGMVRND